MKFFWIWNKNFKSRRKKLIYWILIFLKKMDKKIKNIRVYEKLIKIMIKNKIKIKKDVN